MHLAVVSVSLDLEPELYSTDRERLLRSVRDRVKQAHNSRITIRTDDDAMIVMAFFDDNYARLKARAEELVDAVEGTGEARVDVSTLQFYSWHDGKFQETRDSLLEEENSQIAPRSKHQDRTIVYQDKDDDLNLSEAPKFSRRNMRLPTRK